MKANDWLRSVQPDGKPDVLQQVEHGVLSILGSYRGMGRLYRGIIVPTLQQYVLLAKKPTPPTICFMTHLLKPDERSATHSGKTDDPAWYSPSKIRSTRVQRNCRGWLWPVEWLKKLNPALAKECLAAAEALWKQERDQRAPSTERWSRVVELWLTTNKPGVWTGAARQP